MVQGTVPFSFRLGTRTVAALGTLQVGTLWLGRQPPLTASGARTQKAEQCSREGWLFISGSEHRPTHLSPPDPALATGWVQRKTF